MTATNKARYCRCGNRLARDNPSGRCSPCAAYDRQHLGVAPEVSPNFWDEVALAEALRSRHMGRVIRAWRTHPHHGRCFVSQDRAAFWFGMSQAQLSRVENGPPPVHLDRLTHWAAVLRIPEDRLWFAMPAPIDESNEEEDRVNRRQLIASAGAVAAAGLLHQSAPHGPAVGDRDAVEWLAWHLWQQSRVEIHRTQVPRTIAALLDTHPHVIRTSDDSYRFADPSLLDTLVARRVFGDIAQGGGHLLATAQTNHATDLAISALTAEDERAQRGLVAWMRGGASAVLRVNSAGILAKVGLPELGDAAITAIRSDQDARHLYMTAVASRVLDMPWDQAARLSSKTGRGSAGPLPNSTSDTDRRVTHLLTAELRNTRDAAARWCSAALLADCADTTSTGTRSTIMAAVQQEPCRENLRAYASLLAGTTPLSS